MSPSWRDTYVLESDDSPAALNAVADDASQSGSRRASAIFRLFANHVHPGQSATETHDVLGSPAWMRAAKISAIGAFSGYAPVDFAPGNSQFIIHLFPDEQGRSDWCI